MYMYTCTSTDGIPGYLKARSHIRIFVLTRAKNPRIIRVNLRKFIIITYSSYLLPMFTSAFESFHDCENVTNRRASHYTHIDNI